MELILLKSHRRFTRAHAQAIKIKQLAESGDDSPEEKEVAATEPTTGVYPAAGNPEVPPSLCKAVRRVSQPM
jgi:hypothetical protein